MTSANPLHCLDATVNQARQLSVSGLLPWSFFSPQQRGTDAVASGELAGHKRALISILGAGRVSSCAPPPRAPTKKIDGDGPQAPQEGPPVPEDIDVRTLHLSSTRSPWPP